MNEEIKALREELVRLRERVAVLEARPAVQSPAYSFCATPPHPKWVPQPYSDQNLPAWAFT